ncbi:MAG: homoserine dehydrogenase [Lachnospiraceae bacterium]|nr:homoserine dehydrogenase [uncultured Acetatifactor sp.]MCI8543952.1 homoserine dehydrogenase [Lachnospiraceae bacterium]
MIKIAVLGYGTVGSGVVEVIERHNSLLSERLREKIAVKYILDLRDFPGDTYEDKIVHDYSTILNDPEISILCEVMGGVGAAYQFTKQALEAGKSVCTSNKELVAKHGAELFAIAERMHCNYMFEASVAGGIPIIRAIGSALSADRVEAVTGILNGTTNYILTKMEKEGADYADVLKQAQELGYAERNPEADVEGLDAGRKIAILADMLTGKNVNPDKVTTEGITKITSADFAYAKAAGMTIKLLARCSVSEDGSVQALVAPFMLPADHALGRVDDVFNGVLVTCTMLGDAMFGGQGAGKLPTASAVAADVMDCAMHPGRTVMRGWSEEEAELADVTETERRFFVRIKASALADVQAAFAGSSLVEAGGGEDSGLFVPAMKEKEFDAKCAALGDAILNRIRVA